MFQKPELCIIEENLGKAILSSVLDSCFALQLKRPIERQ